MPTIDNAFVCLFVVSIASALILVVSCAIAILILAQSLVGLLSKVSLQDCIVQTTSALSNLCTSVVITKGNDGRKRKVFSQQEVDVEARSRNVRK